MVNRREEKQYSANLANKRGEIKSYENYEP